MNKGMLTVGIILLSLIALLLINVISNYSSGSELDYYLVKETVEASMEDAVDISYYRDYGTLRMDKEKFVESFLRRFADSIDNTRNYKIGFYDLNEVPPKVSVKVDSSTVLSFDSSKLLLTTTYDGIVESNRKTDDFISKGIAEGEIGNPVIISQDGKTYTTDGEE